MEEGIEGTGIPPHPYDHIGRRSLPHMVSRENPNQSIILYVSCNTKSRRPLLNRPEIATLLLAAWRRADHWLVGRYVIMPDHLHLFCAPRLWPPAPLKRWMEYWRAQTSLRWPYPVEKPIWQKDFFDRQLRTGESYFEKWMYVVQNPVKAGLVLRWDDWRFQGELNTLPWHDPA